MTWKENLDDLFPNNRRIVTLNECKSWAEEFVNYMNSNDILTTSLRLTDTDTWQIKIINNTSKTERFEILPFLLNFWCDNENNVKIRYTAADIQSVNVLKDLVTDGHINQLEDEKLKEKLRAANAAGDYHYKEKTIVFPVLSDKKDIFLHEVTACMKEYFAKRS